MSSLQYWISRTMVIERGTGVIVYALALLYFYLRLRKAKGYISLKRTLNTYIAVLCVLAYFYIPTYTSDLHRWWEIIRFWPEYTFIEFFERYITRSTTPSAYLIMYICSLTGQRGVLPALCSLIFYSNTFYILKDQYRRRNVSAVALSTSLLMIMSSGIFVEIISGIRNFMGLSILARCFYDEFYNNKPIIKNLFYELFAALTHQMCLIILMLRILFSLFQSGNTKLKRFRNVVLVFAFTLIAYIFGREYIASALTKAEGYVSNTNSYSFIWGYLLTAILMIQFILIMGNYHGKNIAKNLRSVYLFNIFLLVIVIVFCFEYSICHRISMFVMITIIPLCAELSKEEYQSNPFLYRHLNYLSLLMLAISCTRGDLCGYKFFLL